MKVLRNQHPQYEEFEGRDSHDVAKQVYSAHKNVTRALWQRGLRDVMTFQEVDALMQQGNGTDPQGIFNPRTTARWIIHQGALRYWHRQTPDVVADFDLNYI